MRQRGIAALAGIRDTPWAACRNEPAGGTVVQAPEEVIRLTVQGSDATSQVGLLVAGRQR